MRQLATGSNVLKLVLLQAVLVGCGGQGGETAPEAPPAAVVNELSESERARAVELYEEEACSMCHGPVAEGIDEMGPPLQELAPYWDEPRLVEYLNDPEAFRQAHPDFEERRGEEFGMEMPAFDHLPPEQRKMIARWLLTR